MLDFALSVRLIAAVGYKEQGPRAKSRQLVKLWRQDQMHENHRQKANERDDFRKTNTLLENCSL
jgi:hypothetical protein